MTNQAVSSSSSILTKRLYDKDSHWAESYFNFLSRANHFLDAFYLEDVSPRMVRASVKKPALLLDRLRKFSPDNDAYQLEHLPVWTKPQEWDVNAYDVEAGVQSFDAGLSPLDAVSRHLSCIKDGEEAAEFDKWKGVSSGGLEVQKFVLVGFVIAVSLMFALPSMWHHVVNGPSATQSTSNRAEPTAPVHLGLQLNKIELALAASEIARLGHRNTLNEHTDAVAVATLAGDAARAGLSLAALLQTLNQLSEQKSAAALEKH